MRAKAVAALVAGKTKRTTDRYGEKIQAAATAKTSAVVGVTSLLPRAAISVQSNGLNFLLV